jgi:hypothetical protein
MVRAVLMAVVLLLGACGDRAEEVQTGPGSPACEETEALAERYAEEAMPKTPTTVVPTTDAPRADDDINDTFRATEAIRQARNANEKHARELAADRFQALERLAILAEQNPECFTVEARTEIEARYRQARS